jgi:ribosomal protein S18 acetylase RimI-like enzyme
MIIRPYADADQAQVVALWQICELTRPWNDPVKDIARKQQVRPEWFLVGELDGRVIASVMFGYEGHRGWMNYLAVAPQYQSKGYAHTLIETGEALLLAAGCPKISLQVRSSNARVIAFYQSLGYAQDDAISLGKRLISDHCN